MAERNETKGTSSLDAQGKAGASSSAQRTPQERESGGRTGERTNDAQKGGQAGMKPRADQEPGTDARPSPDGTEDDEATEEEQDEQGEGEPRKQDEPSAAAGRRGEQGGLNAGENESDPDAKRTTAGTETTNKQSGSTSRSAGTSTNNAH